VKDKITKENTITYTSIDSSSFITHATYSVKDSILIVNFKANSAWAYDKVQQLEFVKMVAAKSVGSYFNKHIRNKYHGVQLLASTDEGLIVKSEAHSELLKLKEIKAT
jgi:hypothetical protein